MNKNLDYYMNLPYTIEIIPIPEDQGGGFTVRLPQVGRFAITGDGETPEEAIADLEKAKRRRFKEYLKKGVPIPEPEPEKEEYSGRFLVRLPRMLHRQLVEAAKANECSLNQYVTYLLSTNFQVQKQQSQFESIIDNIDKIKLMTEAIWHVSYSYKAIEQKYKVIEERKQIEQLDILKLKAA